MSFAKSRLRLAYAFALILVSATWISMTAANAQAGASPRAVAQTYKADCANPSTREDAALCLERTDVAAAQQQTRLAQWQLVLSAAGIGGVIITLVLSTKATLASERAVQATNRAISDAALASKRELRAYVHVDTADLIWTDDGQPHVLLTCLNTGQTPASLFEVGAICEIVPMGVGPYDKIPDDLTYGRWSGLGGGRDLTVSFTPEGAAGATETQLRKSKDGRLSVRGRIRYKDIFGQWSQSEFTFFRRREELDWTVDGKSIRKMASATAALRMFQEIGAPEPSNGVPLQNTPGPPK